jgi:hypothetical protein
VASSYRAHHALTGPPPQKQTPQPQVEGEWRYGRVVMRYDRRWFDAIVYIVDTLARRLLISYLGTVGGGEGREGGRSK